MLRQKEIKKSKIGNYMIDAKTKIKIYFKTIKYDFNSFFELDRRNLTKTKYTTCRFLLNFNYM